MPKFSRADSAAEGAFWPAEGGRASEAFSINAVGSLTVLEEPVGKPVGEPVGEEFGFGRRLLPLVVPFFTVELLARGTMRVADEVGEGKESRGGIFAAMGVL